MSIDGWGNLVPTLLLVMLTLCGGSLLINGIRNNGQKRTWYGAGLLAVGLVVTIARYPETGATFSAISSILIVIFAGFQIVENRLLRQETRELKQQEGKERQERDKRAKQERQLDNIILWAKNIIEWRNDTYAEKINRLIEDNNPLMKSLLTSMNNNHYFIQFRNEGVNEMLPIAEALEQQSLVDSVRNLINDLEKYLDLLGNEQMVMMKESAAGIKSISAEIDSLTYNTITHKRDKIPAPAARVVKEATKIKLTI